MSQPIIRSRLTKLPRNIWAVTATSFLTDVSSEMVFNLLPLFLANVLGAKTAVIGLIEGLAESTASLLKIISGRLSDKWHTRKNPTILGYTISTLAKPLLYFATTQWGVLLIRFADRVGKGIRTAPRDALIADSITPEQRGLAYGLHRAGDTAGAMLGILFALGIVWSTQAGNLTLQHTTFQRVVLWSIIPALLAVIILAIAAQDIPQSTHLQKQKQTTLSWKQLDNSFRRFLIIITLFTLGNSADAFLILRAQERGLTVLGVLGMLATFNLVYALLSGPLGSLSDRVGRRQLIIGGWLVYAALYLGFALAQTAWQIWVLYGLYGIYYGAVEGTAKAFVADLVKPEQRGTAFGLYNAAVGTAVLPANLIAGILWQGIGSWSGFGPHAPFLFGATLALTALFLFQFWLPKQKLEEPA